MACRLPRRKHLVPTACDTPASTAASSLAIPAAIAAQNRRRASFDIDYRYAEGDTQRLWSLAQELIALAPDVFFAGEPSVARAVKALAPDLPIVCPVLTDRLSDLFTSYARPGGSVTGVGAIVEGLHTKVVGLAHDVLPGLKRIALLLNPAGANQLMFAEQAGDAASALGLITLQEEAKTPGEIAPALHRLVKAGAQIC